LKRRILAFFILLILIGLTVGMKLATSPRVDQWLQRVVLEQLEKHLQVKVSLGGFEKNMLMTRVTFNEVTLEDLTGSGKSITTNRLVLEIDPYAFLRGALHLNSVQLEGIFLNITRKLNGSIALEPLFPLWLGETRSDEKPVVPVKLEIDEVTLINGSVTYTDEPAGMNVTVSDVVIVLKQGRFKAKDQRDISVRSREGEFHWRALPEGQSIEIESFRANLVYNPTELTVNRLEMAAAPFSMELNGRIPLQGGDGINGDASLRVDLGRMPWILPGSGGEVTLTGSAGGRLVDPWFRGQLTGRKFSVSGRDMQNLKANLSADVSGCEILNAGLQYRGEDVVGALSLAFKKGMPFELEAGIRNYPLIKLAEEMRSMEFPLGGDVSTTVRASGSLSGGASSIAMVGEMNLPFGDGNTKSARFDLTGQYLAGDLRDLDLEILADNFRLLMNGSLTAQGPDLRIDADGEDLEFFNDIKMLNSLNGSLELDAEITGEWGSVQAGIDATARHMGWESYSADALRIHIDIDSNGVNLPMVSVETGSSTLVGQAAIPWNRKQQDCRFSIETTDARIEDILGSAGMAPFITGQIMGRMEASLTGTGWMGNADAIIRSGKVLEEDYDQIGIAGVFQQGRIVFKQLDILKADRRIRGRGQIEDGRLEADFKSVDPILIESVAHLRELKVYLSGEVDMDAAVRGNIDGTGLEVDTGLTWDQITFDGRTWQGGTADFIIRDRRLKGEGSLLDGIFKAVIDVDLEGEFPFSGTIRTGRTADRDDLNNLLGVRIPADAVSGNLEAEAEATGVLKNLRRTKVEGNIRNADFRIRGIHFRAPESVGFSYYPEVGIRFIDAALWSGDSILAGTLLIAPGTEIEGNLNGKVDLQGFSFLKPTVDEFSGQSIVQLQVSGKLSEPVLNGSINLRGAKCTAHIPFDMPVVDLTGDLEIVGNRLRSEGITGMSNGGLIRMEGDLILERFNPIQGELRWKAEAVHVEFPEGLHTTNRADIVLRFSDGLGVLKGTVSMDQGRFTRQVNIDNLISLIGEQNSAAKESPINDRRGEGGDWLTLDIEMETATPVDVDIKLLRGTARGNLHLQGTAGRPVLAGRMEMDEGIIEYRGHSFDVISGSVGFFNPVMIEPAFDFSARTEVTGLDRDGTVTDYIVDLLATGVPEKFRLDLVSSPPLGEVDIVSLLTWGAVGEQAFASRSGLSAAEATLLLTRELKGTLETGVRQLTGFDRVVINPSAVTSSGERTTRIQVDKKLSDSFYLTYSTPVLTSAEQEVLLKYRISDSFSLIGEQTGEEGYGLDLDFQFQIP
jgi:autotransporter translocation and assembly factor TamB